MTAPKLPEGLEPVAWLTTWPKDRIRGAGSHLQRQEPLPKWPDNDYYPLVRLSSAQAALLALKADADRTERNRDMWKAQCARQAEQLTALHAALIDLYAVASVKENKDYGAVTNAAAVIDATNGEAHG